MSKSQQTGGHYVFWDNEIVSFKKVFLNPYSLYFQYGLGVFETLLYHNHTIYFLKEHLQRLQLTCDAFKIKKPPLKKIKKQVFSLLEKNQFLNKRVKIKILITKINQKQSQCLILTQSISLPSKTLSLSSKHSISLTPLRKHKTANLMEIHHALDACSKTDLLIFNHQKKAIECAYANIALVKKKKLYLIDPSETILPGIMQAMMIKNAKHFFTHIKYKKGFSWNMLKSCDEMLYLNSVSGVRTVIEIDQIILKKNDYGKKISQSLAMF